MRARAIRQWELFDDRPQDPWPILPAKTLEEVLQLLTLWLHDVCKEASREARDEQDQR